MSFKQVTQSASKRREAQRDAGGEVRSGGNPGRKWRRFKVRREEKRRRKCQQMRSRGSKSGS